MVNRFEHQLAELGIVLDEKQKNQFQLYYELLIEWNKVMNLTGITEYDAVNEKHFVDSHAIVKTLDFNKVESMIDIGTGAGFPGIPLKIAFPHLKVTLLDSLQKRIKFLNEVIRTLGLNEIQTLHGRAEDFARMAEYREQYDLCVSRAVSNLSTLCEYCIPYVIDGGLFVSYKSGSIDEELVNSANAIKILGGKLQKVDKFQLPDTDISRAFIHIKKVKNTSKKYPRKAGMPGKEPL